MTTLNLFNSSTFYSNTAYANVTTVTSNVLVNAINSSTVYKINSLLLTNYNNVYAQANVSILRAGTVYPIIANIVLPNNSTIVGIGKDTPLPLQEGDTLQTYANANVSISLTAGYEFMG